MKKEVLANERIVVSDFDGTLIDREEAIPMTTVLAIDAFRNLGGKFVIATGRIPTSVLSYNQDFNFLDYVIACNGAYIYDTNKDKVIYKCPMAKQIIRTIKQAFEASAILYFCTPDCWHMYVSTIYQERKDKVMKSGILDFNRFLSRNKNRIYKIEMHFMTEELARDALKELKKLKLEISANLQIFNQSIYIVEITAKNVDKYEAVRIIATREKRKIKNIVAIGDSYNDIKLIKRVGHGVAVANSCSDLLACADEVTTSSDQLGVEKILEKICKLH